MVNRDLTALVVLIKWDQIYTAVSTGLDPRAQEVAVISISPVTLSCVLDLRRPNPGLAFCPVSRGSQALCPRMLSQSSGPKPSLRFLHLTYQVAAPPAGPEPSQDFCMLAVHNQGTELWAWQRWSGWEVGGGAGTQPEAPFWTGRVLAGGGGQPGSPQPQTEPHEPIAQGHPPRSWLGASESGWGLRGGANEGDWPRSFLGDPGFLDSCLLSFPGRGNGEKAPICLQDRPFSKPQPWGQNSEHSILNHGTFHC